MDAPSHLCTGDPIHMQTQTMGAFATFNIFQLTWEHLCCQSSLWYMNYFQVKPINSSKHPQSYHEVSGKCFGGYKTSSWNKIIFVFVIFSLVFLGINRKEDVSIMLYLAR